MRIGILSDTHLHAPDDNFQRRVKHCFHDCEIILHAGDLVSPSILSCFGARQVHAVHGNMCDRAAWDSLPERELIEIGGFSIGMAHGVGFGPDIEEGLWSAFPETDCIVYGHTHRAVCHRRGPILFINPGSFMAGGRHSAAGTAAILTVDRELSGRIIEVPFDPPR